jgi:hypothetical protein
MSSGIRKALTCRFDLEITVFDPQGQIVESQRVRIGRGRHKE